MVQTHVQVNSTATPAKMTDTTMVQEEVKVAPLNGAQAICTVMIKQDTLIVHTSMYLNACLSYNIYGSACCLHARAHARSEQAELAKLASYPRPRPVFQCCTLKNGLGAWAMCSHECGLMGGDSKPRPKLHPITSPDQPGLNSRFSACNIEKLGEAYMHGYETKRSKLTPGLYHTPIIIMATQKS